MTDRNPPCAALSAPVAAESGPGGDSEPPAARWALYTRSRPGVESLDLDLLRAWAAREGAQVVHEVTDYGPSRAGRAEVLALVARGLVDRVAVVELARLGRRADDVRTWVQAFDGQAAQLCLLCGPSGQPWEVTGTVGGLVVATAADLLALDEKFARRVAAARRRLRRERRLENTAADGEA
ncbi:recombinase family protein [Planotetraspora sp. GP83]|uniref:recombinase family protein n=1 Tax=Planotetraspora sp. GP83 TaxID=3156264 RepID=UPI00351362C2